MQVFTVGYGRFDFPALADRIRPHGATHLVDVRSAPYSRYQEHFREPVLKRLCEQVGLKYYYMGDRLGGRPGNPTVYTDGAVDYAKVRSAEFFQYGVLRVMELLADPRKVVFLLCGCERPEKCHRGPLLGEAFAEAGVDVRHLLMDGTFIGQLEVRQRAEGDQLSLFER